jgi:hypothetical protein
VHNEGLYVYSAPNFSRRITFVELFDAGNIGTRLTCLMTKLN